MAKSKELGTSGHILIFLLESEQRNQEKPPVNSLIWFLFERKPTLKQREGGSAGAGQATRCHHKLHRKLGEGGSAGNEQSARLPI